MTTVPLPRQPLTEILAPVKAGSSKRRYSTESALKLSPTKRRILHNEGIEVPNTRPFPYARSGKAPLSSQRSVIHCEERSEQPLDISMAESSATQRPPEVNALFVTQDGFAVFFDPTGSTPCSEKTSAFDDEEESAYKENVAVLRPKKARRTFSPSPPTDNLKTPVQHSHLAFPSPDPPEDKRDQHLVSCSPDALSIPPTSSGRISASEKAQRRRLLEVEADEGLEEFF